MGEFLIPLDDLFLLLNGLFVGGVNRFTVKSFILNHKLFWVNLSGPREISEVGGLIPKNVYEQLRNRCGEAIGEIPSYTDYLNTFLASGVHKPKNWTQTAKIFLRELNRDPLSGERPVFISFNTNAVIKRYYTLISNFLKNWNAQRRAKQLRAGFVASYGVLEELEGFNIKYSASDVSLMNRTLTVNREILDEFFNQLKLEERIFRMGFVEYRKMSKQEYFEEIEGGIGDINIIKTLVKFSKQKNADILVFSEDSDFVEKATARKLKGVRLDRPSKPSQRTEADWEHIAQLLYTTAITYGAIGITAKIKAKIYGVWRGKKGEHWNTETLKITTENPELQNFLEINQKILKNKNFKKPEKKQ